MLNGEGGYSEELRSYYLVMLWSTSKTMTMIIISGLHPHKISKLARMRMPKNMAITKMIISARQDDYKVVALGDNDDEDGFPYKGDADDHILWFTLMALVVIIISVPHPHKISKVLTDPTRNWTMGRMTWLIM